MRKKQKEVLMTQVKNEEEILKELEKVYKNALASVNDKIAALQARTDVQNMQSIIYQKRYQESIKQQLNAILDMLHNNEYTKMQDYLDECYREGFLGTLYDLQGQNVPLAFPINQEQALKAVQLDSKISQGLYQKLGEDIATLKQTIASEISRGISANMMYSEIARNISNVSNTGMSNAMRIVRTEGHRIQIQSAMDSQRKAKEHGADIMKVWDSTLDGKTRETHRLLDGQICEIDEDFEVMGMSVSAPGMFGDPSEDCNCRCALLQKARWNLDSEETKYLGHTEDMTDEQLQPIADKLNIDVSQLREYGGNIIPMKADNFEDFKRQYDKLWHYEGSDLQKEAEARIAGYKKGGA